MLVKACDEIGLMVKAEKTKFMITSRNTEFHVNISIPTKNKIIEKVNKFIYCEEYIYM